MAMPPADIAAKVKAAISAGNCERLVRLLDFADYERDRVWIIGEAARQGRVKMVAQLAERGWCPDQLTAEHDARLQVMAETIARGPAIFRPSNFWQTFNGYTRQNLQMVGIQNFKRSINQMYGNFIPLSLTDPQLSGLTKYKHYKWQNPTTIRLEDPDNDRNFWFSLYEPLKVFHGAALRKRRLYALLVGRLYQYLEQMGLGAHAAALEEPTIGNPIRVWCNDRLVSQDLATSIDEWAFIERWTGSPDSPPRRVIGELGAGYGRLAYVFLKKTPCRYLIFDIPPALQIAEWYLSKVFPELTIFRFRAFTDFAEIADELDHADIAFLSANQIELIPNKYLDLFITVSSLHEMTDLQIQKYINLMDKKTSQNLFIKQYKSYHNQHDGLVITRASYDFPHHWRSLCEDETLPNNRFFQVVFQQRASGSNLTLGAGV